MKNGKVQLIARAYLVWQHRVYLMNRFGLWVPAIAGHIVEDLQNIRVNRVQQPIEILSEKLTALGYSPNDFIFLEYRDINNSDIDYQRMPSGNTHVYANLYGLFRTSPRVNEDAFELADKNRVKTLNADKRLDDIVLKRSLQAVELARR